ncbi:MAG TPA: hypothetical protein PLS00_17920, partial [Niabella sp.]|nr:hypothetical protein [Niabella sp.]
NNQKAKTPRMIPKSNLSFPLYCTAWFILYLLKELIEWLCIIDRKKNIKPWIVNATDRLPPQSQAVVLNF